MPPHIEPRTDDQQPLSLNEATTHLLEEARMVLPGIQALFGFQLVAVFSQGFAAKLTVREQELHLIAITLVAVAVAMVMTPAALHRQLQPRGVSKKLLDVSSRFLLSSMVPLALGISIDLYLIARVIIGSSGVAAMISGVVLAIYLIFWFGLPRAMRAA